MQKLLRYILLIVFTLCLCVPGMNSRAEAANIVVLPLINNVAYDGVESTFYDNVIDTIKHQEKYELLDNVAINAVIDEAVRKGEFPTEAALREIAQKTEADLVVAIELDELDLKPVMYRFDETAKILVKGKTATFNIATDKYSVNKFYTDEELDTGFYTRQNVQLRFWARHVQREMHRAMQVKGLNLQKPRMSKF